MSKNIHLTNQLIEENIKFLSSSISKFKNKKILITGGTGFIGIWLLNFFKYLNDKKNYNTKIISVSRSPKKFLQKNKVFINDINFKFISADISDFKFSNLKNLDYIFHCSVDVSDKSEIYNFESIIIGTYNIIKYLCKNSGTTLINFSSGATVKFQESLKFKYDIYSQSKYIIEKILNCYSRKYKFKYKNLILYSFLGPHMKFNVQFAIGNFIYSIINNKKIIINGDGKSLRSYMFIIDLIINVLNIASDAKKKINYIISGTDFISIKNTALLVRKTLGSKSEIIIIRDPIVIKRSNDYVPMNKSKIDSSVFTPLSESIRLTSEWLINEKQV